MKMPVFWAILSTVVNRKNTLKYNDFSLGNDLFSGAPHGKVMHKKKPRCRGCKFSVTVLIFFRVSGVYTHSPVPPRF